MTDPCWRKTDLMTATIHEFPARKPQPAPYPVMTPEQVAEFWAAVAMLRAERARWERDRAALAAVPS
jgi:hypothetical protein